MGEDLCEDQERDQSFSLEEVNDEIQTEQIDQPLGKILATSPLFYAAVVVYLPTIEENGHG